MRFQSANPIELVEKNNSREQCDQLGGLGKNSDILKLNGCRHSGCGLFALGLVLGADRLGWGNLGIRHCECVFLLKNLTAERDVINRANVFAGGCCRLFGPGMIAITTIKTAEKPETGDTRNAPKMLKTQDREVFPLEVGWQKRKRGS